MQAISPISQRAVNALAGDMAPFDGADPQEWYFAQGYTDGLPVVPPTPDKVEAMVAALGGDPEFLEARVPPRWGNMTRRVLAINAVMAGCLPQYAPVLRTAMRAKRPGDAVRYTVVRGKQTVDVSLKTIAATDNAKRAIAGFAPEQGTQLKLPVAVRIDAGEIGGPSAGLAFALDVVEEPDLLKLIRKCAGQAAVTAAIHQ